MSCIVSGFLAAQPSLRITSPANGTIVHPGQSLTVTVEASPAGAFQQVIVIGWDPIGFAQPLSAPPYRFTIQIPIKIVPRRYLLTADGMTSPGHGATSDPIEIVVERSGSPIRLHVEPSLLDLSLSEKGYLRVVGEYADGTSTDVTNSTKIVFSSSTPTVATAQPYGIVIPVAPGSAKIIATCGTVKAEIPVRVRGNSRR